MGKLPKLLRSAKNKNLLVAGCGTGSEISSFVQGKDEWKITGVDPTPEMISEARLKFQNTKNVKLIESTVSNIGMADKFGASTPLLVLHFMDDDGTKYELLKSIADKLESHTPFFILDIMNNKEQMKSDLNILRQLLPDGLKKEDIDHQLDKIDDQLDVISEERLIELLIESGYDRPIRFYQNSIYMGWMTKKL